jgi:competence protein ComEA
MERTRAQLFWWAAAALLGALAAMRLLGGCGGSEPPPVTTPVRADGATATPSHSALAYVHVAGRVRRPGLYRLPPSARVAAAIDRAGGPAGRADLAKVNLAARIEDGQQIVVPRVGASAPAAAGAGGSGPGGSAAAKVSLAGATVEQLDALDGIGPTLAKRIIDYRDSHGGFRSVGQLRDVEGIGEKRFEALREAVGP